jgi:hypothetical protein
MQNFRKIVLRVTCSFLMIHNAKSEQLAEPQKFQEISGVVALAGFWENATVDGFSLVDRVGLPSRIPMQRAQCKGCWHILLIDAKGLSPEQAKFISVVLGRRPMIHPIFLDYVRSKLQSKDSNLPTVYLCVEASRELPLKIGAKLTLKSVILTDTGGMLWKLEVDQMNISE